MYRGDHWAWENGQILRGGYWEHGFPKEDKGDCVQLHANGITGTWRNEQYCDHHLNFICEKSAL